MLLWSLTWGKSYAAATEAGKEWVGEEPPELLAGYGGWYNDFFKLSRDRPIGMAPGPIPQWRIESRMAEMPYDDAEIYEACIHEMDAAYLSYKPVEITTGEDPAAAFGRMFGHLS